MTDGGNDSEDDRRQFMKDFRKRSIVLVQVTGILIAFLIAAYVDLKDEISVISLNFLLISLVSVFLSFLFSILGAIVSTWDLLDECEKEELAKPALTFVFCHIPIITLTLAIGNIGLVFLLEAQYNFFFGWYIFTLVLLVVGVSFVIIIFFYLIWLKTSSTNFRNTLALLVIIASGVGLIFIPIYVYFKYRCKWLTGSIFGSSNLGNLIGLGLIIISITLINYAVFYMKAREAAKEAAKEATVKGDVEATEEEM